MNVNVENATRKSVNLECKYVFLKEFCLYFSENREIYFLYLASSRMYNLKIDSNGALAQCCDHMTFKNDTQ